RVTYLTLWVDGTGAARTADSELAPVSRRVRWWPIFAGLIPLIGAIFFIFFVQQEQLNLAYRLLMTGLIGAGMAGFGISLTVCDRLTAVVAALRGQPTSADEWYAKESHFAQGR